MRLHAACSGFCILVAVLFLFLLLCGNATGASSESKEAEAASEEAHSAYGELHERAEEGVWDPVTGFHFNWDNGINITGRYGHFKFVISGAIMVDGGRIDADDDLESAFPGLDGSEIDFRQARLSISGLAFDRIEFKLDYEFTGSGSLKDNWIRIVHVPVLERFRFGHLKEPFSLEALNSSKSTTFMERALPTSAFTRGRNFGILYSDSAASERVAWAAGVFLNTGTVDGLDATKDALSDANGSDVTLRVSGLPWYEDEGRRLLHLGLSYSHGFRDDDDSDDPVRVRARPESHLTDERLVDTGEFLSDGNDQLSGEAALVSGPLSLQGECFYRFEDAGELGDPEFWGLYIYGSYILSGEYRKYKASQGVFAGITPEHNFNPRAGEWGAWELGFRFSYIDLNDGEIRGGEESNITAGLNWYLYPNIRMIVNYIHADVKDRETSPQVRDGEADILQTRFHIAF